MAKTFSSACAQIAILLTIYGSIHCVKSISPDAYHSLGTQLTHIHPDDVVLLPTHPLHRRRRASPGAPADSAPEATTTQGLKYQYQSIGSNVSMSSPKDATVTTVAGSASGNTGSVTHNIHNVGVNGTGQRKDLTSNVDGGSNSTNGTTSTNMSAAAAAAPAVPFAAGVQSNPPKKTLMTASQPSQYPKKTIATSSGVQLGSSTTESSLNDDIDVPDEVITKEAANQTLTSREDHFDYYSSLLYVNKNETAALWSQMRAIPDNNMLSSSHRRAMTVELKFDFPFYGHYLRNVTVATGGFLYTGEYVHSWLAATQYIAPLMANFDTSLTNDSFVRLMDNGTAFTVVWENVTLQDKPTYGNFTFSATLHQNGDIKFVYYHLPTLISNIQDSQHPVKVGLSDAYIVDKASFLSRRKTIYEYHRVTFGQPEITNSTIIMLTALPTCLDYHDCQSCMNHNTTFECAWCPTLNRCSTNNGNDRRKQDWQQRGCDRTSISKIELCPALGKKGNNAAQENSGKSGANGSSTNGGASMGGSSTPSSAAAGGSGGAAVTEPTVSSTQSSVSGAVEGTDGHKLEKSEHLDAMSPDNKNVGVAFGFMVPICLVFAITLWLFYAYRNPHTRSGQLLIQFRPSQWSWRRGEARYTAATIHM
ncbi:plexin domain-containing protein 1 [Drosophila innubila]|uniref:plexin domain-containing protein 1 n=1 Tax=Drosophila innubila TaxID=198719 RepID=UPI00148E1CBF|nr:plexin domain-containing protein 1 [Drosophila innubila]